MRDPEAPGGARLVPELIHNWSGAGSDVRFWPRGGVVVTAGGLIFSGTKSDSTFRAYDKESGKVLWETKVASGPEGIPAVYEVNGREYVVTSARPDAEVVVGDGEPQRTTGNSPSRRATKQTQGYYVFALPDTKPGKK